MPIVVWRQSEMLPDLTDQTDVETGLQKKNTIRWKLGFVEFPFVG